MCGIVAGVAERNLVPILLEGLKRLEYRGYDSAGLAVLDGTAMRRERAVGKVASLAAQCGALRGQLGIAHTRWATHGRPSEDNAHPHAGGRDGVRIVLVHNGIIENHAALRARLQDRGYTFASQTDSEVIAHLVADYYEENHGLVAAVRLAVAELEGAYALAVMAVDRPDELVAIRHGSPMVIGLGIGETFAASDTFALLPVTRRFIYLQEGDLAVLRRDGCTISDRDGHPVIREESESAQDSDAGGKGGYKHFMQKEMFEQPGVIAETLEGRMLHDALNREAFDDTLLQALARTQQLHIIACGTSYHAGLALRNTFEKQGIATVVDVASEYVYRPVAVPAGTLFIAISQSGETADTLAALKKARDLGYLARVAICNVADSAIVREADAALLTRAGREIGVASTKAFITQLVVLHLVAQLLGAEQLATLQHLPAAVEQVLERDGDIARLARLLDGKHGALFLGRGAFYPIALEGALKMKELTYLQAEAYPAGELKHGPLALVDDTMPVIALIADDALAGKMRSNLQEVQARGGRLIVFADDSVDLDGVDGDILRLGSLAHDTAPAAFAVALQLLAYHAALRRGTDVDQPRNLAKSVTVE
ncbi:MAG: glutamine--fructose-6-phosphate transaminase (isomerizing) [Cardiobacteriaceae bacterium]|nr:glutamine--fructose-6-phosphate transaminase (isomerizing) [Cardiobacteriaceae bacterium]